MSYECIFPSFNSLYPNTSFFVSGHRHPWQGVQNTSVAPLMVIHEPPQITAFSASPYLATMSPPVNLSVRQFLAARALPPAGPMPSPCKKQVSQVAVGKSLARWGPFSAPSTESALPPGKMPRYCLLCYYLIFFGLLITFLEFPTPFCLVLVFLYNFCSQHAPRDLFPTLISWVQVLGMALNMM